MRLLAIGDIHGCMASLAAIARAIPIGPDDLVVTLGDYVDRGPDSRGVLNWLIDRSRQRRLIALRGNHELMMLCARTDYAQMDEWLANGGDATLASYGGPDGRGTMEDVPQEHWDFLENYCRDWYETETHFFVHANAYPDVDLPDQPEYMLFWETFDAPPPHVSGKTMICGHTPQRTGRPKSIRHAICIDTRVYGGGWLTCLEPATGRYWQANEAGEQRMDDLDS
ncbi:MAG: metallophosphoesterase family protein [Thermoguttaceae bacterium]